MDHSKLDPDHCRCRNKPLPGLIADWSPRAQERILEAIKQGKPVNMDAIKHEAQLVASLARGGPMAFAPDNANYGHFCADCPFRKRAPNVVSLAVERDGRVG